MSRDPDIETVRRLLDYNPDTGLLTWKHRTEEYVRPGNIGRAAVCSMWNKRYAGQRAMTCTKSGGYLSGALLGRTYAAHRVCFALAHGRWPLEVDHINGDRKDNRLCNLREVDRRMNSRNRCLRSDNSSGATGVDFYKGRVWRARLHADGQEVVVGHFKTKREAVDARREAQRAYGFTERHGIAS